MADEAFSCESNWVGAEVDPGAVDRLWTAVSQNSLDSDDVEDRVGSPLSTHEHGRLVWPGEILNIPDAYA